MSGGARVGESEANGGDPAPQRPSPQREAGKVAGVGSAEERQADGRTHARRRRGGKPTPGAAKPQTRARRRRFASGRADTESGRRTGSEQRRREALRRRRRAKTKPTRPKQADCRSGGLFSLTDEKSPQGLCQDQTGFP